MGGWQIVLKVTSSISVALEASLEAKKEIAKKEQYKKSDEKLVQEATEKEWADVDTAVAHGCATPAGLRAR